MAFPRSRALLTLGLVLACGPGSGDSGSSSGSDSATDGTDSGTGSSGATSTTTGSGTAGTASGSGSTASAGSTGFATGSSTGFATGSSTGVAETGPGTECDGQICGDDEYCDWIMNSCGGLRYDEATCDPRPEGCDAVYQPVCGCDGNVHGNSCEAAAAGVDLSDEGGCEAPPDTFPCGWLFCSTGSEYCMHTPTDAIPSPNAWGCVQVPNDCGRSPSCSCIPVDCFGGSCEEMPDGTIQVTCPGG